MPDLEILITDRGKAEAVPQARPAVPSGHVLVHTFRTLVSPGTELSFFEGTHISLPDPDNRWAKYPFRPGYAVIGEVVEVGTDAPVTAPRVGARIFFFGTHATWNLLSPDKVWIEPPADLSDDAVLLSRLVQIAATGVEILRKPPQRALVVGAGLIGLFAAQTLQARGCQFIVLQDIIPDRLDLARRNGLAHTVLAKGPGLAAARAAFGNEAPDCVIEATGIGAMAGPCLETVASNGDVVLLGIPRDEVTLNLYRLVVRKGAALLGAHEGLIPDRAPLGNSSRLALIQEALAGMISGHIRTNGLVSGHVRPEDCQEFYENLSRDKARWITAVIDWT